MTVIVNVWGTNNWVMSCFFVVYLRPVCLYSAVVSCFPQITVLIALFTFAYLFLPLICFSSVCEVASLYFLSSLYFLKCHTLQHHVTECFHCQRSELTLDVYLFLCNLVTGSLIQLHSKRLEVKWLIQQKLN